MSTPFAPPPEDRGPEQPPDPGQRYEGYPAPGADPAQGSTPPQPPGQQGSGQAFPGQAYPAQPYPAQPWSGQDPAAPSRTLAIIGLVTAIIPCTALVGLVISIIALVRARRGGGGRGMAIAGVVVGALWVVATVAFFAFGLATLWSTCQDLGNGVHEVDGVTYTCNF